MLRWSVIATLLALSSAQADTVILPSDYLDSSDRADFRLCRAAIVIEDSAGEQDQTALPPAVTTMMREQIEFIMAETVFNVPALSLEDGQKRIAFTERFIIDFGKTVGAEITRLRDPTTRAPILINCQPLIWAVMKQSIDVLIHWRRRAMDLDRPFPADVGKVDYATPPIE